MTTETTPGAEAGANEGDSFDAEFAAAEAAAKESETEPVKDDPKAEGEPEKEGEGPEKQADDQKPPLSRDELETRWRNQQIVAKQERTKRQERDNEIAELRQEVEALRGGAQNDPNSQFFDPNQNPHEAIAQLQATIAHLQQQQVETEAQRQQREAEENEFRQAETTFRQAEAEFRQAVPDYDAAASHLAQSRMQELMHYGYDQQQALEQTQTELRAIVQQAIASPNSHPAAMVYEVARARGYQPQQAQQQPNPDAVKQDIQQRQKAAAASQTLSGSGGRAVANGVTIEQLNSTDDGDEFDRLFEEMARQAGG